MAGTDLTGAYLASTRLEGADMSNAFLRREDHENPYLASTQGAILGRDNAVSDAR